LYLLLVLYAKCNLPSVEGAQLIHTRSFRHYAPKAALPLPLYKFLSLSLESECM
jgi:hypothetical protein